MRHNIQMIRDSIAKIVNMLVGKRVKVTQRGVKAFVAYNKVTGEISHVNIPYLPDNATDQFIGAVQGFLDHEVGHILFTDQQVVVQAGTLGKRAANMHNMVEDVFVERRMSEHFAGSGHNLGVVRRFFLDEWVKPEVNKCLAEGNAAEATKRIMVVALRAWGGQVEAADFLRAPELAALVQPIKDALGADLIERIAKCKSSAECLALSTDMVKALEEVTPPGDGPGHGTGDSGSGSGEGEADDDRGDPDTPEPANSDDTAPDDADVEAKEDSEPEVGDGPAEADGGEPPKPDPAAAFDDTPDFDETVSRLLAEQGKTEMEGSDYRVYSTDWDRIEEAPETHKSYGAAAAIKMLEDGVGDMVPGMQKHLERAIAAQDRKMWNSGRRNGRISPGSLYRTAVGDDRVFRTRIETKAKNTGVSLLIDCSGSMNHNGRLRTAALAAFALSSTLERIKVRHEILGFTTADNEEMEQAARDDGLEPYSFSRMEPLYMPIFKGFNERLDLKVRSRLANLLGRPGFMNQNCDGESVQIAGHRLASLDRVERRILIVLSDGQPAVCGKSHEVAAHLKRVVADLPAMGVEVLGIGIQSDAVREYYPRCVVLDDVKDLPATVIGQITAILLA